MLPSRWLIRSALVLLLGAHEGNAQIDFRYAPTEYWTIIGFPDDWQKTLVDQRGSLCYDFGPGPYARPLTLISVIPPGSGSVRTRQELLQPKAPVISTTLAGDSGAARMTTFSLLPSDMRPLEGSWAGDSVRRVGGLTGCVGWVAVPDSVDPLFRNAAWGTNRPILYRVRVEPFGRRRVALGICEPYKARSGMRLMELVVEGAPSQTIEPVPNNVRNIPLAFLFSGNDEDGDGWLRVEVHSAGADPNVFLNAFWVFPPEEQITPLEVIRGEGRGRALLLHSCGTERERVAPSPRADGIIAECSGPGAPELLLRTRRLLQPVPNPANRGPALTWDGEPYLLSSPAPSAVLPVPDGWRLTFPPGTRTLSVLLVHGNHGKGRISVLPDLRREEERTVRAWVEGSFGIPFSMNLPDPALQLLAEASIRTVYQVREHVDGSRQFQPGPTVYRGLWIADVSVTGIPVALMGGTDAMREGLEAGLPCQLPDGRIRSLYPAESTVETPVWAHACFWYGRTTGDTAWIRRHGKALANALDWVCSLRARSLADPEAPYAGLIPPGFVDGGISTPMADYGTLWWCILALDEGCRAAAALPPDARVARWRETRDALLESFRAAARRDLRIDSAGRRYLPVGVGDTSTSHPQLGQFSIVLPIRHERFAGPTGAFLDTVARMNLQMLDGYLKQGLVVNSGWLRNGVWPWLGGAIGIAHQRLGQPDRAFAFLQAYANHASPTGVWVEEQIIQEAGSGSTGDVSDAEASAVFLHLVRYLLVTERGEDLEFLGGLPPSWLRAGSRTELRDQVSEFGRFTLELRITSDGRTGHLTISPIKGRGSSGTVSCVLRALREGGFGRVDGTPLPERLSFPWRSGLELEFRRL